MIYFWLILLILLNVVWLILVVFGLPGNWMMVIGTILLAWWYWDEQVFGIITLTVIVILAVGGEVVEFFAGLWGATKAGAGRRGAWGALLGGMVGAVVGTFVIAIPVLGTLIGSCVGAGLGAWGMEVAGGREGAESVRAGVGAGAGRFAGTVMKLGLGIIIWLIVAGAAWWP